MDFKNFTTAIEDKPKISIKTEPVDMSRYRQVYHLCETCKYNTGHYILEESVRCSKCGNEYKLKTI